MLRGFFNVGFRCSVIYWEQQSPSDLHYYHKKLGVCSPLSAGVVSCYSLILSHSLIGWARITRLIWGCYHDWDYFKSIVLQSRVLKLHKIVSDLVKRFVNYVNNATPINWFSILLQSPSHSLIGWAGIFGDVIISSRVVSQMLVPKLCKTISGFVDKRKQFLN